MFGLVEALTNPMKDDGEWIAKLDIVQAGSKLTLEEQVIAALNITSHIARAMCHTCAGSAIHCGESPCQATWHTSPDVQINKTASLILHGCPESG